MATKKPNVLVMWGDDIGQSNLSCYTRGMMGYKTPNIDRIADEGMLFTDSYAEQSCTAGRASFITGQCGLRTGLTKVGLPGAELGLKAEDITIAEALKPLGYRTGQFGKNHLGDRDEHLPTMHGFDEFFGNLYHLNAEEEPEEVDYPNAKDFPEFKKKYGPRGVLHCWADGKGGQKIENTGPLTKKRMETCDDEFLAAAKKFIQAAHDAGEPFFVWFNTSHMHAWTHVKPESRGQSGRWQSEYHDVMIDHDKCIGEMLDFLDTLGIADNTFVHVQHRQRTAHEHLAGCGHHPLPEREELELGGRVSRALHGALSRQDCGPIGFERDHQPPGLVPDHPRGGRRARHRGEAEEGPHDRQEDLQGPPRRIQPAPAPHGQGAQESAQGLHLLHRRRRRRGVALRQLEDAVHGAARRRAR